MAIPQAKNSNGKSQPAGGARFRQRKISVKQGLTIYKLSELSSNDNELEPSQVNHLNSSNPQQRDLHSIETGVDKNEEDEVHLQQVINAAQKALLSSQKEDDKEDDKTKSSVYIPTPDASRIWEEASNYYKDHDFVEPETYIKFSAQVEDAIGVDYNMDEVDEEFLNNVLNVKYPTKKSEAKCSELEFETIVCKLEKFIKDKQPFLSMDPSKILSFNEFNAYINEETTNISKNKPYVQMGSDLQYLSPSALKERLSKEVKYEPFVTIFDKNPLNQSRENSTRPLLKLLDLFGEPVYNHWKERKVERNGKSIFPELKFEDPNANEKENDNDPYICFRRREFRAARKTRRADTIGIERIRQLQKSLHRAREIMFNVSQREILKLQSLKQEAKVFELRVEAKNVKRALNVSGDDHLFYPHKKKRVIKIKEEEEEAMERERELKLKREKKQRDPRDAHGIPGRQLSQSHTSVQDGTSSSTQPYVKLPPSKIPDIDLVTVSLVLKEKNDTIKRAVLERLRKRKEQDRGFINLTDDPYQPYFTLSTNDKLMDKELKHIPYSSIASADLHQMNTSNTLNQKLKDLLEEGKSPLPGMRTFNGKNGELIPSKAFPHLQTLLTDHLESKKNKNGYIAHLLSNTENRQFNCYINGFGNSDTSQEDANGPQISDPMFKIRRRVGRLNRTFVDRRIVKPPGEVNEIFNEEQTDSTLAENKNILNVYSSSRDSLNRLKSNWRFDSESNDYDNNLTAPFSSDPSKLNSISDETQSIRFGSMLLSKSYELLRESVHQRQQAYIQQVRMRAALQQQQMRNNQRSLQRAQQQAQQGSPSNTSSSNSLGSSSNSQTSKLGSTKGVQDNSNLGSPSHTKRHHISSGSNGSK